MPTVFTCRSCQVDFTLEETAEIRCPQCAAPAGTVAPAEVREESWLVLVVGVPLLLAGVVWNDLLPSDWSRGKRIALVLGFLLFALAVIGLAMIAVR